MNGWLGRFGLFLEKAVFPVSRFLLFIGQFALVMMVILTVVDVCLRYIFNRPILGSYELTEFMMAVLVFSTIGYTMAVKGHVVVDLVFAKLPQRARDILECITSLIAFILFAIVAWRNAVQANTAWGRNDVTAELLIPISPFILFVSIGIAVLSLVLFTQFIQSLAKAIKG
ncbi:MAG: TRAP transporter small permease [Desulfobacterales bacterium]|jgi:TRAP-type C4-dicarboxylate transport system permease small subunit